jgi:hypothetical protein
MARARRAAGSRPLHKSRVLSGRCHRERQHHARRPPVRNRICGTLAAGLKMRVGLAVDQENGFAVPHEPWNDRDRTKRVLMTLGPGRSCVTPRRRRIARSNAARPARRLNRSPKLRGRAKRPRLNNKIARSSRADGFQSSFPESHGKEWSKWHSWQAPYFKLALALVIGVGFRNVFAATENGFKGASDVFLVSRP